jgi:hypothetical protein
VPSPNLPMDFPIIRFLGHRCGIKRALELAPIPSHNDPHQLAHPQSSYYRVGYVAQDKKQTSLTINLESHTLTVGSIDDFKCTLSLTSTDGSSLNGNRSTNPSRRVTNGGIICTDPDLSGKIRDRSSTRLLYAFSLR